jgi:hypothetical protein
LDGAYAGFEGQTVVPVFVDAHVHFHRCYRQSVFFESALRNFRAAEGQLGVRAGTIWLLVLADPLGQDSFLVFKSQGGHSDWGEWSVSPMLDDRTLRVVRCTGEEILVLRGWQTVTEEGLELLSLGAAERPPSGAPFEQAVDEVDRSGAVPVVPWGFGKWSFGRKAVLLGALERSRPGRFFLGDNGGRCALGPEPPPLRRARALGVPVLPGSDPLPFPWEASRAGGYGFLLEGEFDPSRPCASFLALVRGVRCSPPVFGRLLGPLRFTINQCAMQIRRFRGRRA